ncbi:hypothetical protein pb186bvf_004087 [Paramecium bursaria]
MQYYAEFSDKFMPVKFLKFFYDVRKQLQDPLQTISQRNFCKEDILNVPNKFVEPTGAKSNKQFYVTTCIWWMREQKTAHFMKQR